MVFESTETFNTDISTLTKKPKDGYSSVRVDIKTLFDNLSFEQISAFQCVRHIGNSKLIKIRLPISCTKTGSSGGFRLLLIVNPAGQKVIFCHIYPKKGKHGKLNCSPNDVEHLLGEVAIQVENNSLTAVDFLVKEPPTETVEQPAAT